MALPSLNWCECWEYSKFGRKFRLMMMNTGQRFNVRGQNVCENIAFQESR